MKKREELRCNCEETAFYWYYRGKKRFELECLNCGNLYVITAKDMSKLKIYLECRIKADEKD